MFSCDQDLPVVSSWKFSIRCKELMKNVVVEQCSVNMNGPCSNPLSCKKKKSLSRSTGCLTFFPKSLRIFVSMKSLLLFQVAPLRGAYPTVHSMKQLNVRILILLNEISVQCRSFPSSFPINTLLSLPDRLLLTL